VTAKFNRVGYRLTVNAKCNKVRNSVNVAAKCGVYCELEC